MSAPRRLATMSGHDSFRVITTDLVAQVAASSRTNPRLREILCLHENDEDTLHRMLNAMQPGSYVRPHRHSQPPKAEGAVVLSGALAFVPFTPEGTPEEKGFTVLSPSSGNLGVDYRAGLWHTFFAMEPDTVVYEVKPGPYLATTDKEVAPWAPDEGSAEAAPYLANLEAHFRRVVGLPRDGAA